MGKSHVTRRRSGTSRVKDELLVDHTDAVVIGSEGFAGMRSDVAFADRLLCVFRNLKRGQMKSSNVYLDVLWCYSLSTVEAQR